MQLACTTRQAYPLEACSKHMPTLVPPAVLPQVLVIPTDEELSIAQQTLTVVKGPTWMHGPDAHTDG